MKSSLSEAVRVQRLKQYQHKYDGLRRQLAQTGYLWVGTVLRRSLPCGREYCHCRKGPLHYHGPYYYWTRKVRGKTVSQVLPPAEGQLYLDWVGNRQRLYRIIDKMCVVSRNVAPLLLAQRRRSQRPAMSNAEVGKQR